MSSTNISKVSLIQQQERLRLLGLLCFMLFVFIVIYIRVENQHHSNFTANFVSETIAHWTQFHTNNQTHRLPVQITLWSSDFHISPIADIKSIVTQWGVKVVDKSLSGHCHLTSTCARDLRVINQHNGISLPCSNSLRRSFYESYRDDPELRSVDAFVCTHADSLCELFMPFDRPLIVVASTRYEIGRLEAPQWQRWNHNLQKIAAKSEWNSVGANNHYDRAYLQYFTDLTEQQLFYLPNLCRYVTARYQYPPHRAEVLLAPYRGINAALERKLFKSLQSFSEHQQELIAIYNKSAPITSLLGQHLPVTIRKMMDVYPNHYEYSELANHPAIVLLPYQVSIMSFFEFYHMNIPLFIPSPSLMTKWHLQVHMLHERTWMSVFEMPQHASTISRHPNSTCPLHSDPNDEFTASAIEEWIRLSDYFTWPHVTTFDSFDDLFAKLWTTDLSQISQRMKQYNLQLQERVEEEWFRIMSKVAEAKISRLAKESAWIQRQASGSSPTVSVTDTSKQPNLRGNEPTESQHPSLVVSSPSIPPPVVTTNAASKGDPSSNLVMPQMSLEGLGIDITSELSSLSASTIAAMPLQDADPDPRQLPEDINVALRRAYGVYLAEHSCEEQRDV